MIRNLVNDLEDLPKFQEPNIRLHIPNNSFTNYENTNYSSFGFDNNNLDEIKERNMETIIIVNKKGEGTRFFESDKTIFREIYDQKNIKVNIYIRKNDDSFENIFNEQAKNDIINTLQD
jgi:hypothetical protein